MTGLLINGVPGECIPAFDRGFQFGDGLFETIAVREGQGCLLRLHLERLYSGCQRLGITPPGRNTLLEEVARLAEGNAQAVIKLVLTRGSSKRGYSYPQQISANRYLFLSEWPPSLESISYIEGAALTVCRHRLSQNRFLAGIKHLNRLDQVIGRSEWDDPSILEGLMLDQEDRVIEGTMSNLFMLRNGHLYTPALETCGVAGVVRQLIIDHAQQAGIPVNITQLKIADLVQADSLFICNSLLGIVPVNRLQDRQWHKDDWQNPLMLAVKEKVFELQ